MKTFSLVFIALCGVLAVNGDRYDRYGAEGLEYDDYGAGFGFFGRQEEQCPKEPKDKEFCIPIPNRGREHFRAETAMAEFSWKLFQSANTKPNYALCPISPHILLSYLSWAANGTTFKELANTVKFTRPDSIERIVGYLKDNSPYKGQKTKELDISTAFFIADDLKLNSAFVSKASSKVDIERVSFATNDASEKFSTWVKEKSRGSIKPDTSFDENTKVLLASALYFKAKWQFSFPPAEDHDFTTEDGETKQIPMMSLQKLKFNYGKQGHFEWIAIPYRSEEVMVIILPNRGKTVDETINEIDDKAFVKLLSAVEDSQNLHRVNFTIPKFKIETSSSLVEPLRKMGIEKIFTPSADFGYMTGEKVHVSEVKQQTVMDVNEEGTVLVSVTQFYAVGLSVEQPVQDATFIVDRPFIAMIVHNNYNVPYVICKVTDPKY